MGRARLFKFKLLRSINVNRPLLFGLMLLGLGSGCSTFNDSHYFRSFNETTGESTNYFRLKISGGAQFSSARYVSGYYDERAVDLFFNELRVGPSGKTDGSSSSSNKEALFTGLPAPSNTMEKIKPLDPSTHGAFVMILSTDASSVANAIGNFAESNVVAESITNLVNRDKITAAREQQARQSVESGKASAVAGELQSMFSKVPANGGASTDEMKQAYLRILNVIGSALGRQSAFVEIEEANIWLKERRNLIGGQ